MIKNALKSNFWTAPFVVFVFILPVSGFSQNTLSMQDVESRREVSMAEASGKRTDGIYRYYAKEEKEPFTGILFAKYPNGNYSSWQEYVDGVGQGKWINYYENGNPKEEGHYNQNLVEGSIKKYYENGVLKSEGSYKDWRVMIGKWKYYDQKGNLESTKDYGSKGSIKEVQKFYDSGEISYSWYANILTKNGFKPQ
ncbi:hypothetical protein LVD13_04035 [Flavobacteriaceae bacterium D16]|nr:hypothetical protein [Flavobacteriaceae bacterium D16]